MSLSNTNKQIYLAILKFSSFKLGLKGYRVRYSPRHAGSGNGIIWINNAKSASGAFWPTGQFVYREDATSVVPGGG